jgi:hypothetical protein
VQNEIEVTLFTDVEQGLIGAHNIRFAAAMRVMDAVFANRKHVFDCPGIQ